MIGIIKKFELKQFESKDGKNHMLPFCILRGDITFHNIYH